MIPASDFNEMHQCIILNYMQTVTNYKHNDNEYQTKQVQKDDDEQQDENIQSGQRVTLPTIKVQTNGLINNNTITHNKITDRKITNNKFTNDCHKVF